VEKDSLCDQLQEALDSIQYHDIKILAADFNALSSFTPNSSICNCIVTSNNVAQ